MHIHLYVCMCTCVCIFIFLARLVVYKILFLLLWLENVSDDFKIAYLCRTRLSMAAAATAAANPTNMDLDLPVDPNEPTYCLCNQVSYGEMVACDNPNA
ncbi:hypothetical protein L1049_002756 [Liquidambar formosana]|uniref:Uncharacterized protein n=1 Tax=Liquidambar formosana TaxID=63359 RepID=A0AAP0R7P2_LIQFO